MGFYEMLSRYYDNLFPAAPAQVRFVKERVPQGGIVLDVAAGTGNLAVELCGLGLRVTAIDVDSAMVNRIQEKKRSAGEGLDARLMDMRGLNELPAGSYDAVLCVGNSLVHLDNLTEIAEAVIRMYDRLKPGGTLILQTVNYDRILREHIKELPLIERKVDAATVTFRRLYEMEEDGILFKGRLAVVDGGGQEEAYESTIRLLPLQCEELLQVMEQYGLPMPELYGSFQGEVYGPESAAMVAVLRKENV